MERISAVELRPLLDALGLSGAEVPETAVPFEESVLQKAGQEGYILVWCPSSIAGHPITLRFLREHFGIDPAVSEPCFYNQDWYPSWISRWTTAGTSSKRRSWRNPVPYSPEIC